MYVLLHVQDFVGGFNQIVISITFYLYLREKEREREMSWSYLCLNLSLVMYEYILLFKGQTITSTYLCFIQTPGGWVGPSLMEKHFLPLPTQFTTQWTTQSNNQNFTYYTSRVLLYVYLCSMPYLISISHLVKNKDVCNSYSSKLQRSFSQIKIALCSELSCRISK